MTANVLARAFAPCFITSRWGRAPASGCRWYGFASQSRGHVQIVSEAGRGTMVTIRLPRYRCKDRREAL
jgi:hypothetical protein